MIQCRIACTYSAKYAIYPCGFVTAAKLAELFGEAGIEPIPNHCPENTMEMQRHTLSNLFSQLGLPSDHKEIERFINTHRPLPNDIALYRAPFWTPSQRTFLKEEIVEDADWAAVIDDLNARLR